METIVTEDIRNSRGRRLSYKAILLQTSTKKTTAHSELLEKRPSVFAFHESDSNGDQQNYPTTNNDRQAPLDRIIITIIDKSSPAIREYLASKNPPTNCE